MREFPEGSNLFIKPALDALLRRRAHTGLSGGTSLCRASAGGRLGCAHTGEDLRVLSLGDPAKGIASSELARLGPRLCAEMDEGHSGYRPASVWFHHFRGDCKRDAWLLL